MEHANKEVHIPEALLKTKINLLDMKIRDFSRLFKVNEVDEDIKAEIVSF